MSQGNTRTVTTELLSANAVLLQAKFAIMLAYILERFTLIKTSRKSVHVVRKHQILRFKVLDA